MCNFRAPEMRDNFRLYLVIEKVDAITAHRRAQTGELLQVIRRAYVVRPPSGANMLNDRQGVTAR